MEFAASESETFCHEGGLRVLAGCGISTTSVDEVAVNAVASFSWLWFAWIYFFTPKVV